MENRIVTMELPEGNFVTTVTAFDKSDVTAINAIYDSWRDLCAYLGVLDARAVNPPEELHLPEELSEISFGIAKDLWRSSKGVPGTNSSFNFYDPYAERNNNRIQVKTSCVLPDLTSFGPNSQWDRIFFADFYREGKWDGTFDVYELNTDDINNYKVNVGRTLLDQKMQGRSPRFSIYSGLIQKGRYISKETFLILEKGIIKL
ncbi:MAG: Bsp6I family type II restriction endonuclease [Desulfosporosinus sp.]|nr:Bsp6I family type II restriction endonuclease [Desulfosporosinus sp.]